MRKSTLDELGCDDQRRAEVTEKQLRGTLGRVTRVDKTVFSVLSNDGLHQIEKTLAEPPIVGDWVVLDEESVTQLDRRTEVSRRMGVHRDERQALVANVDDFLIVCALDTEPHLPRLTTFVVMAYDSGATPLVVLTKCDLSSDPEGQAETVAHGLGGVETLLVSTVSSRGIEDLRRRIRGRSVVLLGESGAGKSTLTNALIGHDQLATNDVRDNRQGRHTTTHRELIIVPSGGVIIDTPGIREVASFGNGDGVAMAFQDVAALAETCRFSDCDHVDTPGCAITDAVAHNLIDPQRVDSYLRELRDQARLENRLLERHRTEERKSASQYKKSKEPTLNEND